ncbi:MAG TPA: hypothetical protein PK598_12065 [Thermoanaerobaculia bacterium]|nr:hypothetical protein [Thermoanaerobaculia bacterium]
MLQKTRARVAAERPSRKEPLTDADAKALLGSVSEILVAKGKSVRRVAAKEATLDDLRGPTGNFRAPLLKLGRRLLVGFHEETLRGELARGSR